MARMLDLAFKLKQFAASMPTEIKEVHQRVSGSVSLEWEAAIQKAYGRASTDAGRPSVEVAALPPATSEETS